MITFLQSSRNIDRRLADSAISTLFFGACSLALFVFWVIFPTDFPLRNPDSTSYLRFDAYRGAGYPMFLELIRLTKLELSQVVFVQLGLFFLSLFVLATALKKFTSSFLCGLGILIGAGANLAFVQYNFSLITESLFFSSLMLLTALLLKDNNTKNTARLILIGALIAWLILIKPVSWAFVCVPVILIYQFFLSKVAPYRRILALLLGFTIIYLAGAMYRFDAHKQWFPESFLGNQLVGKLAFIDFDPERSVLPDSSRHWLTLMKESKDIRKEHMQSVTEKFVFSLNIYDYLRFRKMPEILEKSDIAAQNHTDTSKALAFSIIRQNPVGYMSEVALQFSALWTLGELQTGETVTRYNKKLDSIQGKITDEIVPYRLEPQNPWAFILIKSFLVIAIIANLVILFLGLRPLIIRHKPLPSAGLSLLVIATMVQSYFLLTALLQAGLTRYAIAAWPLHLVLVLAATVLLFDYLINRKSPDTPPSG